MKRLPMLLLLWLAGSCLFAAGPNTQQVAFRQLSLAEARQQAGVNDQLFFLYFAADWCLPCQWMEENTFSDPQLADYVNMNYLPVKVDMDQADNQVLKAQFSVHMIPSILVFSAAGVLVDRQETTLDAEQMLEWLQELNSGANHLRAVSSAPPAYASNTHLLDAPRPVLGFSRPALVPESEVGVVRPSAAVSASPAAANPVRSESIVFSPRSGEQYGIAVGPESFEYAAAIQRAAELEAQFDQRADLLPVGNQQFRILLGPFGSQSDARRFLIFLNRNDLLGEVVPMER